MQEITVVLVTPLQSKKKKRRGNQLPHTYVMMMMMWMARNGDEALTLPIAPPPSSSCLFFGVYNALGHYAGEIAANCNNNNRMGPSSAYSRSQTPSLWFLVFESARNVIQTVFSSGSFLPPLQGKRVIEQNLR